MRGAGGEVLNPPTLDDWLAVFDRAVGEGRAGPAGCRLEPVPCPQHGPSCVRVRYGALCQHFRWAETVPAAAAEAVLSAAGMPRPSSARAGKPRRSVQPSGNKGEAARKVLTLGQPWASAVVLGLADRIICQRTVRYRGPLLIHAGARRGAQDGEALPGLDPNGLPYAAIVGSADLVGCVQRTEGTGYEWFLTNPRPLDTPVPWKSSLFLWTRPPDLVLP
jgi:hypothetical protein